MAVIYLGEQTISTPSMLVPEKSSVASVMYIGDLGVGKTSLAYKLINHQSVRIKVNNKTEGWSNFDDIYQIGNIQSHSSQPTLPIATGFIEMQVKLLTPVKLKVDWSDTSGKIWRHQWQQGNFVQWQQFQAFANNSKAIVVVLPPYREIGDGIREPELINLHKIPNQNQWCNRFDRWVDFFLENCPNTENIILCINKADLFCDIQAEANKLAYNPSALTMDWVERNNYVINKYFSPIKSAIAEINRYRYGLVVRCFITSIYNQTLVDLPWLYLASYL